MRISVVVPCYNAAEFLPETIASVRGQTRPVHELFVVDDGSTDASPEIAARLGARVLRTPANAGPFVARNIGLAAATGDLVASLDADDVWHADHCEVVAGLLERFPTADVAFSGVRYIGARSYDYVPKLEPDRPVDAFWQSFYYSPVPHSTAIMRRAALQAVGGYAPERVAADYDLWLRMSRRSKFVCTHAITVDYRTHPGQISSRPERQLAAVYRFRHRLWEAIRADGEDMLKAQVAGAMREIWAADLLRAWQARDRPLLRMLLGLRTAVPGAPLGPRLRAEALLCLPAGIVDRWGSLGPVPRARLKRLLGLQSEPGAPAEAARRHTERAH